MKHFYLSVIFKWIHNNRDRCYQSWNSFPIACLGVFNQIFWEKEDIVVYGCH